MKIGSKSSKTKMSHEITRQEQNRRNNIKRLTVSAVVALILFIALTIIQSSILNQEDSIKVYQVIKDINEGTKITAENITEYFQVYDAKESLIPEGYITDENLLIGKFINRKYKAKDIVTTDGVTDSAKLNISNIKNPVQVSFSLTDLTSSVSGTIREGDYVNIYGMRNGFNKDGEVVLLTNDTYTFKHVYIEKAYKSSGEEIDSSDKESEATLFTITIEESDVDLFNEMLTNCSIKVAKIMYETDEDYKAFMGDDKTSSKSSSSKKSDNNTSVTAVSNTQNTSNTSSQSSQSGNNTSSMYTQVDTQDTTEDITKNALDELNDSLEGKNDTKRDTTETVEGTTETVEDKKEEVKDTKTTKEDKTTDLTEKETTKNSEDTKEK